MIPRVRQTRNYERFEWRIGPKEEEGLGGADGTVPVSKPPPPSASVFPVTFTRISLSGAAVETRLMYAAAQQVNFPRLLRLSWAVRRRRMVADAAVNYWWLSSFYDFREDLSIGAHLAGRRHKNEQKAPSSGWQESLHHHVPPDQKGWSFWWTFVWSWVNIYAR